MALKSKALVFLALALLQVQNTAAGPLFGVRDYLKPRQDRSQNGLDAQQLNAKFATLSASDPCNDGESACVEGQFAQCVGGSWSLTPCSGGLQCVALPLVNSPGTSVTCDTIEDAVARITASGAQGGLTGGGGDAGNGLYYDPAPAPAPEAEGDGGYGDYYGAPPPAADPSPVVPDAEAGNPVQTLIPAQPADAAPPADNAQAGDPAASPPTITLIPAPNAGPAQNAAPAPAPVQTLVPARPLRARQFGAPPAETISTLSTTLPPVPITTPGDVPSTPAVSPPVVTPPPVAGIPSDPAAGLPGQSPVTTVTVAAITVTQTTTVTLIIGAPAETSAPATAPPAVNDPFTTIASIPQSVTPPAATLAPTPINPAIPNPVASPIGSSIIAPAPVSSAPAPPVATPSASVAPPPVATLIPARGDPASSAPPTLITPAPPANGGQATSTIDIESLISKTLSF